MIRLMKAALIAAAPLLIVAAEASAERVKLGYGRLYTNDVFVGSRDRWRTGSVASSRIWGPEWTGALPGGFGDLIELRIGGQIIAPESLTAPAPGDRPYAGALSLGAHTHFQRGGIEMSMGADLVVTGPATQLDEIQNVIHDLFNINRPSDAVKAAQIENGVHPTLVVELGHTLELGGSARLRPFVEGRAGAETLLRAGVDLTLGQLGRGELLVRDKVSGQRYRTIRSDWTGYSVVLGADVAEISDSVFLPEDRGYTLTDRRDRVRAGLHWQNDQGAAAFYGVTWLGEEFEGQREGQYVGSIQLRINF